MTCSFVLTDHSGLNIAFSDTRISAKDSQTQRFNHYDDPDKVFQIELNDGKSFCIPYMRKILWNGQSWIASAGDVYTIQQIFIELRKHEKSDFYKICEIVRGNYQNLVSKSQKDTKFSLNDIHKTVILGTSFSKNIPFAWKIHVDPEIIPTSPNTIENFYMNWPEDLSAEIRILVDTELKKDIYASTNNFVSYVCKYVRTAGKVIASISQNSNFCSSVVQIGLYHPNFGQPLYLSIDSKKLAILNDKEILNQLINGYDIEEKK
jgi:hypothetical protein